VSDDPTAAWRARALAVAGKLLIGSLFWWSGIFGFILGFSETVGFIASKLPFPALAAVGAGAVELVVPVGLFFRRTEPWAALFLAAYCLLTAVLFHDYWAATGGARASQEINFFKNLALAGALLTIVAYPRRGA
jgi:putative oxidoreductase